MCMLGKRPQGCNEEEYHKFFFQSVPKSGKFLQGTEIYSFIDLYIVIFCTSCCN